MKGLKNLLLISLFFLFFIGLHAEAPKKMSYQAVVRYSNNEPVIDKVISIKISILKDSTAGSEVYVEKQYAMSNSKGLISAEIGSGVSELGLFSDIKWGSGPHFIKTDIDVNGGDNYTISAVSQLLSVPYALYSENSGSASNALTLLYTTSGF